MTACRFALALPVLCAGLSAALAAPPEVTTIFPQGAQRGTSVTVTIGGKIDAETQVWSSLPEITAAAGEKPNTLTFTVPAEAPTGVTWLRFHNAEGATSLKPFVVGTLPETLEKEPNDKVSAPQSLENAGTVVNGVLSKSGEVDVFAVPLKAGQTFVASVDANRTLGSPMDAILQIVSPAGAILEQNDDTHGFDPQIVFTPAADGIYLVRLFAFPSTPNSSVRFSGGADYIYRLTLTTGPYADHALPMALPVGATGAIHLNGWNLNDEVRNLTVAERDDVAVLAHPALANTLTLPIVSHPSVSEAPRSADAPLQELTLPVTVTGTINEPGASDRFRFQGKKGDKITLRAAARSFSSPLDPVVRLFGPDGNLVREVDDSTRNVADPELSLALPADGEYQVEVADLHQFGGMRYVYRLTVEPTTPGFSLKLASDAFTATKGKPLEIPVTVTRANGFAGAIEIKVTGLPEGLTIAPVISENKGDSAKSVKLIVPAEAAAWSGPIGVTGTAREPELTRPATADLTGLGASTPLLWLTIPAK